MAQHVLKWKTRCKEICGRRYLLCHLGVVGGHPVLKLFVEFPPIYIAILACSPELVGQNRVLIH
jgi:hypothetical protein